MFAFKCNYTWLSTGKGKRMSYSDYYKSRKVSGPGKWLNRYFAALIVDEVRRHCKEGDSVIEIGPGEGRVADLLNAFTKYCAYEASPAMTAELKERGISVHQGIAPPLVENDASQHIVIATHVVEHMPDYLTAQRLFQETNRVLVPGGVFIVVSPDFNDMGKLFFDVDYSHNFITTANRLSQLAKDSGFNVVGRKFLYGALEFWPGIVFNLTVKLSFSFLRFVKDNFCFEDQGIFKLEHLFSRAVYMVFEKPK